MIEPTLTSITSAPIAWEFRRQKERITASTKCRSIRQEEISSKSKLTPPLRIGAGSERRGGRDAEEGDFLII